MFSIQRYDTDLNKIGDPQGVFYTKEKAREIAEEEDILRILDCLPVQHFEIVEA